MASRTRTLFTAAATLIVAFGLQGGAPAVDRGEMHRGRWPALAEARLMAATREGGQQAQAKQQPPPPPSPQTPPADPTQPPVFRTGINFVRVDVIISDKAGNPVADLTAADFDVNEDGKPQKIETFKLVKLDGGRADSMKEPPKEIRTDYDEEAEAARDDVRLFSIFLDDYHVRKGASLASRNQLARFIETQLGPSDMVGVMYPLETTSSVRMTRNHSAVMRGLQQFEGRKFDYTPRNQFEETYANYPTETVERIRNQVSLSAIKSLIVHMGSLKEGRKTLVLVSEGYSNMVAPQMRNANAQMPGLGNPNAHNPLAGTNDVNEDRAAWMASMDMETDLREVYDTANKNNVAIYAVDPRGLTPFEFDINEGVGLQTDTKYLNSTMDTLRQLAEQTDGRAIVNRNDLVAGMKQITRDASAYYLIGYNSSRTTSDGKFHEIKVRVKRPGVQVRARKGYWALNQEETARALAPPKPSAPKAVDTALAAVNRPSRASVVRTWIGTSRGENGKTRVTFVWEPLPKPLGEKPGTREEPSSVNVTAVAPDGSPYFRGAVPSKITFDVMPGKMQLRMSVAGAASQVLDSEIREITVPDLTSPQTTLGTPEVLRARTPREFQQLKADASAVPIAAREFSRTDRLLIRVSAYGPGGTAPTLSVHLLNRAGSSMSELQASPAPTAGLQQVDLPLAALAPGEYVVEITATGEGGEAKELVGFRVTG
jgi:VWFA-related protein